MTKNVLFFFFFFITLQIFAQEDINAGERTFRLGFNTGINYSMLRTSDKLTAFDTIKNKAGAIFGLVMNYRLSNRIDFSPKLEFEIIQSQIITSSGDSVMKGRQVLPGTLNFMTYFIYQLKSGNNAPYVFAGPKVRFPLNKKSEVDYIYKSKTDIAIDLGVGFKKTLKYTVLSPELRYSFGFRNINRLPSLKSLHYNNISMIINF